MKRNSNDDTIGLYDYKGFSIYNKTEYNPCWDIDASFLYEEYGNENNIVNWVMNNRIYNEELTTLAKAKKYLRENEETLKTDLRNRIKADLQL